MKGKKGPLKRDLGGNIREFQWGYSGGNKNEERRLVNIILGGGKTNIITQRRGKPRGRAGKRGNRHGVEERGVTLGGNLGRGTKLGVLQRGDEPPPGPRKKRGGGRMSPRISRVFVRRHLCIGKDLKQWGGEERKVKKKKGE